PLAVRSIARICSLRAWCSSDAVLMVPYFSLRSRARPPCPTLFPYTTLFRSLRSSRREGDRHRPLRPHRPYVRARRRRRERTDDGDRKSTRLNSSHQISSYALSCLKIKHLSRSNQRTIRLRRHVEEPRQTDDI